MYYHKLADYEDYIRRLIARKSTFDLVKTSYTRKINFEDYSIIFNDKGKQDKSVLPLINKVRKNAKDFKESGGVVRDTYINFFKLFELPQDDRIVSKIDIRAAYWNYALNKGIITDETDVFFQKEYSGSHVNDMKKGRLKALGSLATTKQTYNFEDGIRLNDLPIIKVSETKEIYMEICRGIDDVMKEAQEELSGCVYYYWDCIFISPVFERKAIEFFKDQKYDVSVGVDKLEYVEIAGKGHIISHLTDKMYMVRREDKALLDGLAPSKGIEISKPKKSNSWFEKANLMLT